MLHVWWWRYRLIPWLGKRTINMEETMCSELPAIVFHHTSWSLLFLSLSLTASYDLHTGKTLCTLDIGVIITWQTLYPCMWLCFINDYIGVVNTTHWLHHLLHNYKVHVKICMTYANSECAWEPVYQSKGKGCHGKLSNKVS